MKYHNEVVYGIRLHHSYVPNCYMNNPIVHQNISNQNDYLYLGYSYPYEKEDGIKEIDVFSLLSKKKEIINQIIDITGLLENFIERKLAFYSVRIME